MRLTRASNSQKHLTGNYTHLEWHYPKVLRLYSMCKIEMQHIMIIIAIIYN